MYTLAYEYMGFTRTIRKIKGHTYQNPDLLSEIESVAEREKEGNLYPIILSQTKIDTDGIVLPNGKKNIFENGNYKKRVGKYIITGDEVWELRYTNNNYYTVQTTGLPIRTRTDYQFAKSFTICDKLPVDPDITNQNNESVAGITTRGGNGSGFIISCPKAEMNEISIGGAIEWIKAKNGITVWYELATPITVPLTLTKINLPHPLRSLPNGVCDEVVGNKLIQRVGKYIITGNEYYELRYQNNSMFTIQCSGLSIEPTFDDYGNSDKKMMCDKAVCKRNIDTTFISDKLTVCARSSLIKGFIIAIPKNLLTQYTIDKAKEYIKSLGDITVYYELATPIEHTLDTSIKKIRKNKKLKCYNNIKPNII